MNVTDTVKSMLLGYPALFKSRMDCLVFLFTVDGNGYDWDKTGELVQHIFYGPEKVAEFQDEEEEVQRFWESLPSLMEMKDKYPDMADSTRLRVRKYNNDLKFIQDNINLICNQDDVFSVRHLSNLFLNESSKLLNLPENITDDWIIAAEAVISHIVYNENNSSGKSNIKNNLKFAEKAKKKLNNFNKKSRTGLGYLQELQ